MTTQRPLTTVNQPRRLLPDHLNWSQDNLVILTPVVLEDDDGGDDVGGQLVHVGGEAWQTEVILTLNN